MDDRAQSWNQPPGGMNQSQMGNPQMRPGNSPNPMGGQGQPPQ